MEEKTDNIDILEKLIKDYTEISHFFTEKTKVEIINVRIIVKAIQNLIAENKELKDRNKELEEELEKEKEKNKEHKEENNILKEKIITIRNYVKPYSVWYDSGTKNYNLKGCSKQEIYKTFSKIRSEVKGEYIFLDNDKYLKELLGKE